MSDEHGCVTRRGFLRTTVTAAVAGAVSLSPRPARSQKKAVTLKVLARDYTLRLDSPWRTAGAELKRRHPELDINLELEGSPYNDQRRKALISTQAGQGADIVQMDNIWLAWISTEGNLPNIGRPPRG